MKTTFYNLHPSFDFAGRIPNGNSTPRLDRAQFNQTRMLPNSINKQNEILSERKRRKGKLSNTAEATDHVEKARKKRGVQIEYDSICYQGNSERQRHDLIDKPGNGAPTKTAENINIDADMCGNVFEKPVTKNQKTHPSNKHVDNNHLSINKPTHTHSIHTTNQANSENTNLIVNRNPKFLTDPSSNNPYTSRGFCDGLAITFGNKELDNEQFSRALFDLSQPSTCHAKLKQVHFNKKNPPYKMNFQILAPGSEQYLGELQFQPNNRNAHFARMRINPNSIGQSGINEVKRMLKGLFGPDYRNLLAKGNLSKIDPAVDIYRQRLSDLIIFSNRARASSLWHRFFSKNGVETWETETLYIGSPKSDYFVRSYDKAVERWQIKGIISKSLWVRIEASHTPRNKGKSVPVEELMSINNPFAPIQVAYYPASDSPDPWFPFFLSGVREWGAEEALRKMTDKNKRARFRQFLLDHDPDWWQPEKLWADVISHLASTGLLPESVFSK
jgi:hypothetical protein